MIRETYRRKKEAMLKAIRSSFPPDIRFTNPHGGMFTWLSFAKGFDTARFLAEQALPRAKVAYVPGATFFPVTEEANHARFSYTMQDEATIARCRHVAATRFDISDGVARYMMIYHELQRAARGGAGRESEIERP